MEFIYLVHDYMNELGFEPIAFTSEQDAEIRAIEICKNDRWVKRDYDMYLTYEVEEGETPLTYEEWIRKEYIENEDCSPIIEMIEFVKGAE